MRSELGFACASAEVVVDSRFPRTVVDETVVEPTTVVVLIVTVSVEAVIAACAGEAWGDVAVDAALPPANVAEVATVVVEAVVVAVVVASDEAGPEFVEATLVPEDVRGAVGRMTGGAVEVVAMPKEVDVDIAAWVAEVPEFTNPVWRDGFDWGKIEPAPTSRRARARPAIAPTKKPLPVIPPLISIL